MPRKLDEEIEDTPDYTVYNSQGDVGRIYQTRGGLDLPMGSISA